MGVGPGTAKGYYYSGLRKTGEVNVNKPRTAGSQLAEARVKGQVYFALNRALQGRKIGTAVTKIADALADATPDEWRDLVKKRPKDAAITLAVLQDKLERLEGWAAPPTEVLHTHELGATAKLLIEEMRRRGDPVLDITPTTSTDTTKVLPAEVAS